MNKLVPLHLFLEFCRETNTPTSVVNARKRRCSDFQGSIFPCIPRVDEVVTGNDKPRYICDEIIYEVERVWPQKLLCCPSALWGLSRPQTPSGWHLLLTIHLTDEITAALKGGIFPSLGKGYKLLERVLERDTNYLRSKLMH